MMLVCLSASYREHDFQLIGQLAGAAEIGPRTVAEIDAVNGIVVLSTCNRFELYLDATSCAPLPDVIALVAAAVELDADVLTEALLLRTGSEAFAHLVEVASGLDSMAVGEVEISGQVARSLATAHADGTTTTLLEQAFQQSAHTAHLVRNQTSLNQTGRSLVARALDLAEGWAADWQSCKVLLIGTGSYAGVCAATLSARGLTEVEVTSASGRELEFAQSRDLVPVPIAELEDALGRADLVIACTRSEDEIVTADRLARARLDGDRPQLLIDLAVPNNLDPAIRHLPGVGLLDLETIRLHLPHHEAHANELASELIADAVAAFTARTNYQQLGEQLTELRRRAFAIADGEHGAPDEDWRARHLMARALDPMMRRVRQLAADGRQDEAAAALELLFGIPVPESTEAVVDGALRTADHNSATA